MDTILEFIKSAFQYIKNLIVKVVKRCLNFFNDIVTWFKNIPLRQGRHVPFIASPEAIKKMIMNAPVKNVGIFKGVYDMEMEEITEHEYIMTDALDEQTKACLKNKELVVLN